MQDVPVEYKGWKIKPTSRELRGAGWSPSAVMRITRGGQLRTKHAPVPTDTTRKTEKDADAFAVALAKQWIDDKD